MPIATIDPKNNIGLGDFNEPADTGDIGWRSAQRKEGQTADQLLDVGIKYSGAPKSFYAILKSLLTSVVGLTNKSKNLKAT